MQLLYITPEALRAGTLLPELQKLHAVGRLGLLAVDEAHCISSWGHDFRPAYRQLSILKQSFGGVPLIALTATATRPMQQDIQRSLKMEAPRELYMGFDRPNIYYTVVHKSSLLGGGDVVQDIVEYVQAAHPAAAIIGARTPQLLHSPIDSEDVVRRG